LTSCYTYVKFQTWSKSVWGHNSLVKSHFQSLELTNPLFTFTKSTFFDPTVFWRSRNLELLTFEFLLLTFHVSHLSRSSCFSFEVVILFIWWFDELHVTKIRSSELYSDEYFRKKSCDAGAHKHCKTNEISFQSTFGLRYWVGQNLTNILTRLFILTFKFVTLIQIYSQKMLKTCLETCADFFTVRHTSYSFLESSSMVRLSSMNLRPSYSSVHVTGVVTRRASLTTSQLLSFICDNSALKVIVRGSSRTRQCWSQFQQQMFMTTIFTKS
jgi:hypothetical protein